MLQVRASDKLVAIGTHGRGFFTTDIFSGVNARLAIDTKVAYPSQQVKFVDASTKATSWAWNFGADATPATATTKGPHTVTYSSGGVKTITLTINGTQTTTQTLNVLEQKTLPYTLTDGGNFESNPNDFAATTTAIASLATCATTVAASEWERGTPTNSLTTVNSGTNAWKTDLDANVSKGTYKSYLYTPIFDLCDVNAAATYTLKFNKSMEVEFTNAPIGVQVQYSTNFGNTWQRLGSVGDANGTNWYDANGIDGSIFTDQQGFANDYTNQATSYNLQALKGNKVAFRFVLGVSGSFNAAYDKDGFMIDDFEVAYTGGTGCTAGIVLGTIPTNACVGSTISVPFTTSGTFNAGNTFTAQLSDATGNFTTPTATATGTSAISLPIPAALPTGTGYKVRVIASNPNTVISNVSANIAVNPLPADRTIVANPTSVTTGNSSNIEVPNSETGVNYQLQNTAGNVNVGTVVAGNGGTINLPTGNLTANTSFRVVATNATTSCTRTLNTVTVTITAAVPTITLGTITPTTYCVGATINVPFTTTGTFAAGNVFTAQLSSATGDFTTPTATGTATTAGTISLTAPTVVGTGYKVRVVASNPTTTSTSSADITLNALPADRTIVANPTSVTTGNSSNIEVPTSETGVNYQLQNTAGNVNVGTVVAGNGGTINLPTGNLTANTSFRVVATNATTSCTRTLNTVTVTITAAVPTITLGTITPTTYCVGATINVPFTTTGTFNAGNVFTAQLSSATGDFTTPTATGTATTAGTISLTAPTTVGTGYKVRVIASNPTTTSTSSADITLNALPADRTIVANPTSVTTGNSSNIEVPTSETGVNYQLQNTAGNINVGTVVAGTGATINLPTGNLTTNTSFRVVATNATTSCTRTLNTVTVTITAAVPTITLGTITPIAYCVGSMINVPFTTTGTFNAGNVFTAQLSSATGDFTTPTATGTATAAGTISLTAPTVVGTGYKVRVVASNPTTTSTSSADITLNALPADRTIVANPTSVTTGNSSNIEVPTSETGVNYQLQNTAGNVNVGGVVAGTGATIILPTGNLTTNTSFRVVATNATTSCTRTLNTVTVTITAAVPTITLGTITPTAYCVGSMINVPFTTTGTFNAGNVFTAQLSSATGDFTTPTATGTATAAGTISLTAPTVVGTGYKVRVVASNPTTTSTSSADITLNALPADRTIVANPTSVTTGNSSNIEVPTSETGVNYQLQNTAGNVNVGTVVAGNGGTINLPTGNLTANTSFRVVATNATTSCTRTLNTVTVTVTAAVPTITLGTITPTAYCVGSTISVPFTTTGTFAAGNVFTAQLSSATGDFTTPTATGTATTAGTISLTAPTTVGTGYKVRVIASDPTTTSTSSADITLNALPADRTIVANPTSVTTGNSSNIEVPTSQTGVNYQLQNTVGNANVGGVVAGTGATINLPTGNLTATSTFRVVATNATTTCTRTLNNVTVTVTAVAAPTIALGTITPTAYCVGTSISVPFTTTGTFAGGNIFTAEMSDAAGNFTTITATATGTTPISLTAPTTVGTGYKVRVRASNPATTSNSSADITLNALPTNLTVTANPASVTTGNGSNIQVPTSQTGVNYQLQISPANTNVGTAVAGTGATINLPTGNLTATSTFRVVATNATTSCTRTLNTITVTIAGATGGGGGGTTTTVATPTNFRATGVSTSQINLTWNAVAGATSYIITSGNTQIATLPAGTVSYNHTGLTADTSYAYTIVAINGAARSATAQARGRTLPNAPTIVSVIESCGSGTVRVNLNGTGSVYRVYTGLTTGTLVAEVNSATFVTPVLTQSTTYFISTVSNGNESARTRVEAVVSTPITATISEGSSVRSCGATTTLTANEVAGATYAWLVNGVVMSGATTNTLEVNRTSSYQVRITRGGCTVTSSFSRVTLNYAPTATIAQGDASNFCENGVISANEVANATYEWSLNGSVVGSARQLTVSASGNYTLKVTEDGCSATDAIQVTVTVLPSITISSSSSSFCANEKVTLTADNVAGVRYDWSRRGRVVRRNAGSSIEVSTGGDYSVTISQNNCSVSSTSINVERIAEQITYLRTTENTLFVEPRNTSTEITDIVWIVDGTESTTFSGETITPTESGSYSARVTYSTGCTYKTRTTSFTVFVPAIVTGEENDLEAALRIYPNPSTGTFRIELGNIQEEVTLTVTDALGRLIKTEVIPSGTDSYNLSLGRNASGAYTVQLQTEKGVVIKKLMVE